MRTKLYLIWIMLLLIACGPSTRIVNSWRDPEVTVNTAELNKFMVAALLRDEATRRTVEDQMASQFPGKAVQSYNVLGMGELKENDDYYNAQFKSQGFDGIVIMRFVRVEQEARWVPTSFPSYYMGWRGYYGFAWTTWHNPGYITIDRTYYVEVNVYSFQRNKLIWSGITSTFNPSSQTRLFNNVISAVTRKMKEQGFLK
ncbi:MAG: hypothetical protein C5B59_05170 [Bacteroidetes bacterium]|nr:MAG: hypothetical protein C5B59_05170 [Bacteroidota bacterium]